MNRLSGANKVAGIFSMLVLTGSLLGCGSRPLAVRVGDEEGRPIAGAVVYVEAWKNAGAYDFCFGISDAEGRIPAEGQAAPQLQARPGGRMTVVVMADGYWPLSQVDHRNGIEPESLFIPRLRKKELPPRPFDGSLGGEFPFLGVEGAQGAEERVSNSDLIAKAAAPENEALRKAFLKSFADLDAQPGLSPEAKKRWLGLDSLDGAAKAN